MGIKTKKRGTRFGTIPIKRSGTLTPEEWAVIMVREGFPINRKVIAEGLGIINRESGFSTNPGGDGAHFGGWQEDDSFGTEKQRLDPFHSTRAAKARWAADGHSFYPAWGRWQLEQGGVDGATQYGSYMTDAANGIKRATGGVIKGGTKNEEDIFDEIGNIPGDILGLGSDTVGGVVSAGDFLAEMAETILDFKKLGQLAAEAFGWFIRLILKAIWDYAIAPLYHWTERAVSWYWINFFSAGTEKGSGVGYVLRQNAGIITIMFWGLGYAVLWSDGESASPTEPHSSLLGQAVKGVEGKIARRNLIKPDKVQEETPDKPEPQASAVKIERVKEFSVARKRAVKVAPANGTESLTGRKEDERSRRQTGRATEAETESGSDRLILPHGVKRPEKKHQKNEVKKTTKAPGSSKPGTGSRTPSGVGA